MTLKGTMSQRGNTWNASVKYKLIELY